MAIQLLLFDLGGVIFRFDPAPRLALMSAASGVASPAIEEALWASGFAETCDRGDVDAPGQIAGTRDRVPLDLTDEGVRDAWCVAFTPDAAVVALLDRLDPRLAVGTFSNNSELIRDGLTAAWPHLMARFRPAVWAYEAKALKPAHEAYRYVERVADVASDAICFVDDSARNVEGARAAGWDTIHFTGAAALRDALEKRGLLAG